MKRREWVFCTLATTDERTGVVAMDVNQTTIDKEGRAEMLPGEVALLLGTNCQAYLMYVDSRPTNGRGRWR